MHADSPVRRALGGRRRQIVTAVGDVSITVLHIACACTTCGFLFARAPPARRKGERDFNQVNTYALDGVAIVREGPRRQGHPYAYWPRMRRGSQRRHRTESPSPMTSSALVIAAQGHVACLARQERRSWGRALGRLQPARLLAYCSKWQARRMRPTRRRQRRALHEHQSAASARRRPTRALRAAPPVFGFPTSQSAR